VILSYLLRLSVFNNHLARCRPLRETVVSVVYVFSEHMSISSINI